MRNAKSTVKTQQPNDSESAIPMRSGSDNCLAIGTRLADFEITGIVGEGGFGIVYLAFDHSLRRTVAIKEYMPGALAGRGRDQSVIVRAGRHQETFDTGLKSFINEARLLARFDHPALVKVYRFWEENKTGYMAMRYYEGETLKAVVKDQPELINEAWLKAMLKPMLEALETLYKIQILHRDISPDNIMIQKNGDAVLLDFGAARQIIGDMAHALTVILKPGYAPVEQYADDTSMSQGPWTDIYALSAVVYFAIVKKPPPTSVGRMITDPIESLVDGAHSGYSTEFLAAIDKGLAVRPETRPQSIAEFRALLGFESSPLISTSPSSLISASPSPLISASPSPSVSSSTAAGSDKPHPAALQPLPVAPRMDARIEKLKKRTRVLRPESDSNAVTMPLAEARASTRRSWILVTSGLFVMTLYAGYHFFNRAPVRTLVPIADSGLVAAPARAPSAKADVAVSAAVPAEPSPSPIATPAPVKRAAADVAAAGTASRPVLNPAGPSTELLTGTVRIMIKPWGTIIVDGKSKGVSPPLKHLRLPEGKHQIKIVNPNFADYSVDLNVSKNKSSNIEYDFSSPNKTKSKR